ncbi:EamA family transporter [Paenibacillus sp. YYML68]|uniref:EamA family transporter n=1 Tax=Paenibacillus sp. YYML68 TaxID=2909250 RepID=UPI00248F5F47|nr:EamA family transporter [Paenibacillus sp. YYML68]
MWFILAAASAACFGLRGILYRWSSKQTLNRNLMLLGVYTSGMIITFIAALALQQPWTPAVWLGVLLGLFSFVANGSMYKGYSVGKTSLIAMFSGLPPVVVALLAFVVWDERLSYGQLAAFVIIMSGLLLVRYSNDLSLRNLQGAQWGVLTMLFFGLTDFMTKVATNYEAPVLPVLSVMFATGALLFGAVWLVGLRKERAVLAQLEQAQRELAAGVAEHTRTDSLESASLQPQLNESAPTQQAAWSLRRTMLWGMVVGLTNTGGMLFAMPAFQLGVTGLVSVIIASNVVMVMLYARFVLKDVFTRTETYGLILGLSGIVLLKLVS